VKLVLAEPGTKDARELYRSATWIQSSRLLVPEAHAAISRARRDRRYTTAGAARAVGVLRQLLAEVEPIDLDDPVAERAGELAATLGLRGADAVHLASFEHVESEHSVLVASDGDLIRAARALGHAVAIPAA
jgi:predicted nucleic acid-binding protein